MEYEDWVHERAVEEIVSAVRSWVIDESDWFWENAEDYPDELHVGALTAIRAEVLRMLAVIS